MKNNDLTSLMGKTIKNVSWVTPVIDEMNLITAPPQNTKVFIEFTDGFSIKLEVSDLGLLDIQEPEGYNGPGIYEIKLKQKSWIGDEAVYSMNFKGDEIKCLGSVYRFYADSIEQALEYVEEDDYEYVKFKYTHPFPPINDTPLDTVTNPSSSSL